MSLSKAINIEDLRLLSKRRLPRIIFDFLEGGVEDEHALARNEQGFLTHRFLPRYLVDVDRIDQSTTLFDRTYSNAVGIAPMGVAAVVRPRADLILAEAAAEANVPFILSGAATASIEQAAKLAPANLWCQLYVARDRQISRDLVRRAQDCGVKTLVLTVDVPVAPKRERNLRNGFTRSGRASLLSIAPSSIIEALRHPAWLVDYFRNGGMPGLDSWQAYAPKGASNNEVNALFASQTPALQTWDDIQLFREWWPGKLVLKGIMHPDDARRAMSSGLDGIIVSNHGGRQLDRSASSIEALALIRNVVQDKLVLMLDSGVRRGADVVIARALGARYVFAGRPFLYGVAVGGLEGARKALAIYREEIEMVMKQIGYSSVDSLSLDCMLASVGQEAISPPSNKPRKRP